MKGGDFLRKNGVPDFGNGSKREELNVSKSSPICANERTLMKRAAT